VNRFLSGVGSFLIFYAISLAHPAIVDAISGVRYAVIFLGALLLTKFRPAWLQEKFRGWQLVSKAMATGLVVAGLVLVGLSKGRTATAATPTGCVLARRFSRGCTTDTCREFPPTLAYRAELKGALRRPAA